MIRKIVNNGENNIEAIIKVLLYTLRLDIN